MNPSMEQQLRAYCDDPAFIDYCHNLAVAVAGGLLMQQAIQMPKGGIRDALVAAKVAINALPLQAQIMLSMYDENPKSSLEQVRQALDFYTYLTAGESYAGRPPDHPGNLLVEGIPGLLDYGIKRSSTPESDLVAIVAIIAKAAGLDSSPRTLVQKALAAKPGKEPAGNMLKSWGYFKN